MSARAEGIIPCFITGSSRTHVHDIVLRDIRVEHAGGGQPVAERLGESNRYPENRMFGHRNPAVGLYVRHAERMIVDNFVIAQRSQDFRLAVVLDDGHGFCGTHIRHDSNSPKQYETQGECTDVAFQ